MEVFEKIKGDLKLRKQQLKRKPRTVEEELFELYFKHYFDVRERSFGFDDVLQEDKIIIAETAYFEYEHELWKILPTLENHSKRNFMLTAALCTTGLGFTAAKAVTGIDELATVGMGLNMAALLNATMSLHKSRNGRERYRAYLDDALTYCSNLKYKDDAEMRFDEIRNKKQKNREKIM